MTSQIEWNAKWAAASPRRHYWLREDFDHLMGLLPGAGLALPGSSTSGASLTYPKHTEGAAAELKLRGLECDGFLLQQLADEGIIKPGRGHSLVSDNEGNVRTVPSSRILYWSKEDIDAAAEHLYLQGRWCPWTSFCLVGNLRFGQAVKAHRVAAARYGLGFTYGFDPIGLVTVIEPPAEGEEYAFVRFYPKGTKLAPEEKAE